MVSVDSLNYDILLLICAYLTRDELVSVSLVSRSFQQGALPHLYHTLVYRISHKKKFPKMMTPFQTVLLHPNLAVHVRCCELSAIPLDKGGPRCDFISHSVLALKKCHNLEGFYCTPDVLPSFIKLLPEKRRLKTLHVRATLSPRQTQELTAVSGLKKLRLDRASWSVVDSLPLWAEKLKDTLTNLSIHLCNELSKSDLNTVLKALPNLTGLHIRSCPKIDHVTFLSLVANNSHLEEIGFTTWESMHGNSTAKLRQLSANLRNLKTLSVDSRNMITASGPLVLSSIFAITAKSNSPIETLSLHLSESVVFKAQFIEELLIAHCKTLKTIRFTNCVVPSECLEKICRRCQNLEKLYVSIPGKPEEILPFARALAKSSSLRTLVDDISQSEIKDPQAWLNHRKVRAVMESVPSLQKLVSDRRCWMGEIKDNGKFQLSFTTLPRSTLKIM